MLTVLASLLSAVAASLFTALILRAQEVPKDIRRHDRRVAQLRQDLRRWIRDRDRMLQQRLSAIETELAARGLFHSGGHLTAKAFAKREALQEYRDHASEQLREVDGLGDDEGRLHRSYRRRRDRLFPQLAMPEDCKQLVAEWRAPVTIPSDSDTLTVDDPSRPELEREIAELEGRGL